MTIFQLTPLAALRQRGLRRLFLMEGFIVLWTRLMHIEPGMSKWREIPPSMCPKVVLGLASELYSAEVGRGMRKFVYHLRDGLPLFAMSRKVPLSTTLIASFNPLPT